MLYIPRYNKKVEKKNFDLLIKRIKQQTMDEENVSRIYKRYCDDCISFLFVPFFSFERFLDSFLYYVGEMDVDGSLTTSVNSIINPILDKIKEENPYSNVNEKERRILLSINDTMKKSVNLADSEKTAIKHNLQDLAIALEEKQEALKKSMKSNRLTWLGILITIIVGVIPIILSSI